MTEDWIGDETLSREEKLDKFESLNPEPTVDPDRWVRPRNGRVLHLVDRVRTGWEQTERSGGLVFRCGKYSNEAWLIETSTVRRCRSCTTWEGQ